MTNNTDSINKQLKFIFLGATEFSKELLMHLINNGFIPEAIFAIPREFYILYRNKGIRRKVINFNYANLKSISEKFNIPYFEINGEKGKKLKDYREVIKSISPHLILVLGWYYMVPKSIRSIAPFGAWGIHASLLPKYAGGAPLVWAIINGEKETGVTLFKLSDGIDDGDIIAQRSFTIDFYDSIKDVYRKAIKASKDILLDSLINIDKIKFKPQDKSKIEVYPQRTPEDGKIDWNGSVIEIYNFIRAQTNPYPGAFTFLNGHKLIVWKALPIKDIKISDIGRIVSYEGKYGVQLKDGMLEILEVTYKNEYTRFSKLVLKLGLLNRYIDSSIDS